MVNLFEPLNSRELAELDLKGAARVVETLARTGLPRYISMFPHELIPFTRRIFYQSSKTPVVVRTFGLIQVALSLIMAVKPHSTYSSVPNRWNPFNLAALAMPLRYEFVYFMRPYAKES